MRYPFKCIGVDRSSCCNTLFKVKIRLRSSTWRNEDFHQLLVGIRGISLWDKCSYKNIYFISLLIVQINNFWLWHNFWNVVMHLNDWSEWLLQLCCNGQCTCTPIHRTWHLHQDSNNSSISQHRGLYSSNFGTSKKLSLPPLHQTDPSHLVKMFTIMASSYLSWACRVN